ncbi:MAG: hypothetical protein QXM68_01405 [Candidatus Aenigmatarchaeota archaeon]|nr:hypothetical protein [Candidatus Aenigmarchaeota archaeon]
MPVVGYYIRSIEAKRRNPTKDRVDINTNLKITAMEKANVGIKNKEPSIDISFELHTRYEPDVGEISMEGNVMYIGPNINEALKMWKNEKKILQDVDIEVKNFLLRKCMTIEINLAENMGLPPPIMFPTVIPADKRPQGDTRYIG